MENGIILILVGLVGEGSKPVQVWWYGPWVVGLQLGLFFVGIGLLVLYHRMRYAIHTPHNSPEADQCVYSHYRLMEELNQFLEEVSHKSGFFLLLFFLQIGFLAGG